MIRVFALRRGESDGSWDFLFRAWTVAEMARFLNHDGEYEREQPLEIINDFDYVVVAERDPDDGVWVGPPDGYWSEEDLAMLNTMTQPGLPVVVVGASLACPRCGGSVQCSTVTDVSCVPVCVAEGRACHDWSHAGSSSSWPVDYHCASCRARLTLDEAGINAQLGEAD